MLILLFNTSLLNKIINSFFKKKNLTFNKYTNLWTVVFIYYWLLSILREVSDGEDETDTGEEKQYTDKKRMFKLKGFLGQLDTFYQQKKLNLLQARSVSSFNVITWFFPQPLRVGRFLHWISASHCVFNVHHGVSTCHRKAVE